MSKFKINKNIKLNKPSTSRASNLIRKGGFDRAYSSSLGLMFEDLNMSRQVDQITEYYTVTAYATIYTRVSNRLKEVISTVDSMRYFYLVEVILNQITEDALAPKMGDESIIRFSSQNETIQKELDELQKRIGLDQLIENITPDLLAYGEYTLATKIDIIKEVTNDLKDKKNKKSKEKFTPKNSNGLLDVKDIVDQGTVISLTQDGKIEGYLVYDEVKGRVEVKETADYIKFSMGGTRIKIDSNELLPISNIQNPIVKEIVDKIPRFIRMGKSVLYPVLSKIKELEILEKLIPATKINKLSQGNLIGINLPENYNLEEAETAVRRIESMINKKISVDPVVNEITVESILSTAGKTKVIPLFGDKGRLEQMDFRDSEPDDLLANTKELRELILDSIGVPSELVYKSDGEGKAEVLKRYAKYLRKLKKLQKTLSHGCKQMAFIHLANKGIKFREEEIDVIFNNTLVEIDNLDKLEHADVTLSLLGNVTEFFDNLVQEDSPYKENVNLNKVTEYLEENLRTVGLADAIKTKEEGGEDADKEAALIPDEGEVE